MIKVLLFVESLRSGGKERRVVELLKSLHDDRRFHMEVVLTREEIAYPDFLSLGIRTHIIQRKGLKKDPRLFFLFLSIALRYKPDILHVWGHMPAVYALPAKILLRIPMINNEIADAAVHQPLLAKGLVFALSDRIIANTRAGLVAYQAPANKSRVIYNGFDFQRIRHFQKIETIRKAFGISTRFAVAMVASFSANKDYATFIAAAASVIQNRDDVTFLCVGAGQSEYLQQQLSTDQSRYILFPGRQTLVEELMHACDIGVLTTNTRHHSEGISNALLEFMALGKPVIATADGGSMELITADENGILIPPFSSANLTAKINYLLDRPEECLRLGARASETVKTRFSMQAMTEAFIEEYLMQMSADQNPIHENTDDRIAAI